MDKDVEEYLRSVVIPEHEAHRQELRRKLLNEVKQKQRIRSKREKSTAIVYVLVALACISALLIANIINWKYQTSIMLNGARGSNTVPKIIDMREYGGVTMWGSKVFEMPSGVPDSMDWYPL